MTLKMKNGVYIYMYTVYASCADGAFFQESHFNINGEKM